jgi:hypothetical protein
MFPLHSLIGCRGNISLTQHSIFINPHKLFDEAVVDVSNGQLVRLPELSSRLTVGEKGSVSCFRLSLLILRASDHTSPLGYNPSTRKCR